MGMLRCNLVEGEEPAMARFLGGLNREIQDILAYKDYTNVTRLFHLACKAEREVQERCASTRSNVSAGKSTSWQPRTNTSIGGHAPVPTPSPSHAAAPSPSSDKPHAPPTTSATKTVQKPAASAFSVASMGRTRDVQCHCCKGFGHVQLDCPSKRVLVVKDDGAYSSASDFDEDTLALFAADHVGNKGTLEEHIDAGDTEHYKSLIVQRVLNA
jgi:hypothetical protein